MSEFIEFTLVDKKPKTNIYSVHSKKPVYLLGFIKWYGPWRQYCFFPYSGLVFERNCLRAITDFIENLMEERKRVKESLDREAINLDVKGTTEVEWGVGSCHIIE